MFFFYIQIVFPIIKLVFFSISKFTLYISNLLFSCIQIVFFSLFKFSFYYIQIVFFLYPNCLFFYIQIVFLLYRSWPFTISKLTFFHIKIYSFLYPMWLLFLYSYYLFSGWPILHHYHGSMCYKVIFSHSSSVWLLFSYCIW